MSTVSIWAPSRVHAHNHFDVMPSAAVELGDRVEGEGERVGESVAQRAGERGGIVERQLLTLQRVPHLVGAVPRLAPVGEEGVDVGAGRAVARVMASCVDARRPGRCARW